MTDYLAELDRVRAKLIDAAEHWAGKASTTQHYSDAGQYALVAHDIADLAGRVEGLRFQWTPQAMTAEEI